MFVMYRNSVCPCLIGDAGVKMPPLAILTAKTVSVVCPKCGILKKSGKLNCCARGGAWFKNCGDVGHSNFDHTWAEGIQACKSKSVSLLRALYIDEREFVS